MWIHCILCILEIPSVTVTPTRMTSVIGSSATMRCDIEGSYTRIEWTRADGRPLPDRAVTLPDYSLKVGQKQLGVPQCS